MINSAPPAMIAEYKAPDGRCPTDMIRYMGDSERMPDINLDDLLGFLGNGTYNVDLMTGGSTPWGHFHPIAERALLPKKIEYGRLFEATLQTGNKHRDSGKSTIFLKDIFNVTNKILANQQIPLTLQIGNNDFVKGRVVISPLSKVDKNDPTLQKLQCFVDDFLNQVREDEMENFERKHPVAISDGFHDIFTGS